MSETERARKTEERMRRETADAIAWQKAQNEKPAAAGGMIGFVRRHWKLMGVVLAVFGAVRLLEFFIR